ncbi:putative UPF0481 protein At3g02645 [Camellia sinensis]|uniref:putative UPF0481 protein At3g02645 n=1 Tax=Camellia sinensis TaxID=4442 RepID=UPI00103696F6|nr:putative UPF0481 protein At3g02645 [Camellia sinensis]
MVSNSNFDEDQWVIQIRRTLDEELEDGTEIPVSIFNVPKTLMVCDPDCYIPQEVALGPYHYWRPELYEMQRYKLVAAKTTQRQLQNIKFHHLVDQLMTSEAMIRASYHKYLDINGETLAWMMAVDASFLLEFLQIYTIKEGKACMRKSAHNAILRDMVMLENQIPLFLLRTMLEFQCSSLDLADQLLLSMLMGFCKELSPFKMIKQLPNFDQVTNCAHLPDLLYRVILPKWEQEFDVNTDEVDDQTEVKESNERSFGKSVYVRQLLDAVWKLLSKLNTGPIPFLKRVLFSKPAKVISKLPLNIISELPGFLFSPKDQEDNPEDQNSLNSTINKPLLVEEISIPSVTELSKVGVSFIPSSNDNICSISFDVKTATLYLPTVSLELNTEVVLRNLVAYEACNASGPLVFSRYTELMNGIIDTEEDVRLLREKGIILNRLKSDKEVANLWNGMNKSVRLTKVPFLDKVIEDTNKYYNGKWKVKVGKFMKLYVFGSWQCLSFLASILLLLLTTFQAFCSVYNCSRLFHVKSIL